MESDEAHHLTRVLRKKPGDSFQAVDGQGNAYDCEINQINSDGVLADIHATHPAYGEPRHRLTLAAAITKKDKFEWIIEKGTEIGVCQFLPLVTQRTIAAARPAKLSRWRRIALSAMKQCGRAFLPPVSEPRQFSEFLNAMQADIMLIAHEKETERGILQVVQRLPHATASKHLVLCVGPEGGLTEDEISQAMQHGFVTVGLGKRRLRTETAAILAAGILLTHLEPH